MHGDSHDASVCHSHHVLDIVMASTLHQMLLCLFLAVLLTLHPTRSTWWQPRDTFDEMATTETGQFRLPPQLDVNSGNVSEIFTGGNGK